MAEKGNFYLKTNSSTRDLKILRSSHHNYLLCLVDFFSWNEPTTWLWDAKVNYWDSTSRQYCHSKVNSGSGVSGHSQWNEGYWDNIIHYTRKTNWPTPVLSWEVFNLQQTSNHHLHFKGKSSYNVTWVKLYSSYHKDMSADPAEDHSSAADVS